MVYLIHSNLLPAIKNRLKKMAKEILGDLDEINFVRYDGSEVLIQECVDDANNLPLGYDKKVVAVENCYFLSKERTKNKIESDQDYSKLLDFINHPSEECFLFLTVGNFELDTKSEIVKAIEQYGKIISIAEPDQGSWKDGVAKYCRENLGMKIDDDAIIELADRTGGDVASLQNNATKLSLYKDYIKYEDVCLMVTRPLEDDTFKLFNLLISENNIGALALYRDLRVLNTEPVTLIAMLASQFLLLSQVNFLYRQRYSNDDIAAELKIKPGRAAIMVRNCQRISSKALKRTLEDLYNLDLQIKSGQLDRFYAFELFLINFKVR